MRKLGKKVTLDKRSLQAYKFCVCLSFRTFTHTFLLSQALL